MVLSRRLTVIVLAVAACVGSGASMAQASTRAALPFKVSITGRTLSGPEECEPSLPGRTQCRYRISGTATGTRIGTIVRPWPVAWFGPMTEYFTLAGPDGAGGVQTPFSADFELAKSDGSGTVVVHETGVITGSVAGPGAVTCGTHRTFSGSFTVTDASSGLFAGATGSGTVTGAEDFCGSWSESLAGAITYSPSGR